MIIGLGIREQASLFDILSLYQNIKISNQVIVGIAIWDQKVSLEAVQHFIAETKLPLFPLSHKIWGHISTPSFSPLIHNRYSVGSVAEALAIAACKYELNIQNSIIITPRQTANSGNVTMAIAGKTL